jgi:polyphosphate kinase 2 (PPK2 family)
MLADDGTVILKFFLHISKKEQRRRFEAIAADPLEAWRVSKDDLARHKNYARYLAAAEEMLELTESEFAPWTIVEATSKSYTRKRVFETIIAALEKSLGAKAPPRTDTAVDVRRDAELREAMESLTRGGA